MLEVEKFFKSIYKKTPEHVFQCGGRFEILGNHTDHNHGLSLVATCDLKINAAASYSDDNIVYLYSKGHVPYQVSLEDLKANKSDMGMPTGIIKGIARYFVDHGYKIGGLKIAMTTTIPSGAGISSSAAVEMCISKIFSLLFNDDRLDNLFLAKCSQYAENEYFGKASGLLDQIGVGFGAITFVDFKDIDKPLIKTIDNFFDDIGFVIVNTGNHEKLSHLYKEIPNDMYLAAKKCGHNYLRECSLKQIEDNKGKLTENEYNRSKHFFEENDRVSKALQAIENNDRNLLFDLINSSRNSSTILLKNMMVNDRYDFSPLQACDYAMEFLKDRGACKINGGGFAGSIICFMDKKDVNRFVSFISKKYGKSHIYKVNINKNPVLALK